MSVSVYLCFASKHNSQQGFLPMGFMIPPDTAPAGAIRSRNLFSRLLASVSHEWMGMWMLPVFHDPQQVNAKLLQTSALLGLPAFGTRCRGCGMSAIDCCVHRDSVLFLLFYHTPGDVVVCFFFFSFVDDALSLFLDGGCVRS